MPGTSTRIRLRQLGVLALNAVFNREIVYRVIGKLNRQGWLASVFVMYPASEKYSNAFVNAQDLDRARWSPWLVCVFRQDGKLGLGFAVSSMDRDFRDPSNAASLGELAERTERIRSLVGASQKTFAGILPGVLFSQRIIRESVEAEVTVEAVVRAEAQVRARVGYADDVPLILLGGRGFIGRRLMKRLADREVWCVEMKDGQETGWPDHLTGTPAIALNVTQRGALASYMNRWWPELVLLNEVYPEPPAAVVDALRRIGSPAFHVVGVEAQSFPPFPEAYAGGIPCCAARLSEEMRTIIRQLD